MKQFILVVLAVFYTKQTDAQRLIHDIDSLISTYILEHNLPSLAVGVVTPDSVLYSNTVDIKGIASDKVYNIASLAKPLTSFAIMMLYEEGKVALDDPVIKYIDDFKLDSKYYTQITIRQLLTHTSGLPNVIHPDAYKYTEPDTSTNALKEHIEALASIKLQSKPGKKYLYSNIGFEILGQIIANVNESTFQEYMSQHLFEPLGMHHTRYKSANFENIAEPSIGHPFRITSNFPDDQRFVASGNLFTNIGDMNRWVMFNLNNGSYEDFTPLSGENFRLFKMRAIEAEDEEYKTIGWFEKDSKIGRFYFHDGMSLGYTSLSIFIKNPAIGITILANHQDADCNEILNLILKSIRY